MTQDQALRRALAGACRVDWLAEEAVSRGWYAASPATWTMTWLGTQTATERRCREPTRAVVAPTDAAIWNIDIPGRPS